jgi:hypothetical protein
VGVFLALISNRFPIAIAKSIHPKTMATGTNQIEISAVNMINPGIGVQASRKIMYRGMVLRGITPKTIPVIRTLF